MKSFILATACILLGSAGAFAQSPNTSGSSEHPPTQRMDAATPEMKGPGSTAEHPPTQRMDEAVPAMKPGDKGDTGSATGTAPEDGTKAK